MNGHRNTGTINHNTHVPPITPSAAQTSDGEENGSTSADSDDQKTDDEEEDDIDEDFQLNVKDFDDVKLEMKKRMLVLSNLESFDTWIARQQIFYMNKAMGHFGHTDESWAKISEHLLSCDIVETFQKMWRRHFKGNTFNAEELDKIVLDNMVISLRVMWNISDKSAAFCKRIIKSGLHADMFEYLKSDLLSPGELNRLTQTAELKTFVQGQLGTLHNVVQKTKTARENFRKCGAVDILQPFRQETSPELQMVSCVALMIQCYLVNEDENEKINSDESVFKLLVKMLELTIRGKSYNGVWFAVIEVLEVINKLATNDSNKLRIVEQGALPFYVEIMRQERIGDRELKEAAHGLWTLAFKCRESIISEPGCLDELRRLARESSSEEVKKMAQGALWILEDKVSSEDTANVQHADDDIDTGGHVFISYQWDSKKTVLKVRDRLRSAGYRVWIDEDDICGSVLEAMARAVEKAVVVIVCLSQKYKESANCRTEAEYTFRLQKRVVPLLLQPDYLPDGWLGALAGSKLVIDCSLPSKFEESMRNLVKELGNVGKGGGDFEENEVSAPAPSQEKSSPVNSWTSEDIDAWLDKHKLRHLSTIFSEFDGTTLLEYQSMRLEAPEAFFADLQREGLPRRDRLRLSRALKDLV